MGIEPRPRGSPCALPSLVPCSVRRGTHARITAKHHAHMGQHRRRLVDERRDISDAASAASDAQCDETEVEGENAEAHTTEEIALQTRRPTDLAITASARPTQNCRMLRLSGCLGMHS